MSSAKIYLIEGRLAEVRPAQVRRAEVRPLEVRPVEVCLSEVRPAKVCPLRSGWILGFLRRQAFQAATPLLS